ncbi:MAG: transporter substrate-binding domain-containing protein [Kiritimatiellae bacterium]|nr:transporter substrate-binding domain-containing protein [Kiritimatiellia bacterium]
MVRIGTYDNVPKAFRNAAGEVVGIFPDILKYVAREEGWEIVWIDGTWEECLRRLENGDIDVMLDVAFSKSREETYDFSEKTVFVNWGAVYARRGVAIQSFLDLAGKRVAVMRGSIHTDGDRGIKVLLAEFDVDADYLEFDDYEAAFKALDAGTADAAVVNRLFGALHERVYGVSHTSVIFNPRQLKFACRKGFRPGQRLLARIDYHVESLKQEPDSFFGRILEHYFSGATTGVPLPATRVGRGIVSLTGEEREWLKAHSVIRLGVDPQFAPFEFVTEDGRYAGIASSYVSMIGGKLGVEFRVEPGLSWKEAVQRAERGEIDVLPCVGITEGRKQYFLYSKPYLSFPRVIITQTESDVRSLDDLRHLRVGVQVDSSHHGFVQEQTQLKPVLYDTFQEAMRGLSRGENDAVVGNLAVATHTMKTLTLTNLKIACHAARERTPLAFAVRKDWPPMVSLLDKAIDSISGRDVSAILEEWVPAEHVEELSPKWQEVDLTSAETAWLKAHPVIRVATDPYWAPVAFEDSEGRYRGLTVDYMRALSELLGVRLEFVPSASWYDAVEKLRTRQADVLACTRQTPAQCAFAVSTAPFLSLPVVLFARDDTPYIHNMAELRALRVAAVKGYGVVDHIKKECPGVEIVETPNVADALRKLQSGEATVYPGTVLVTSRYIREAGYSNLKVAGSIPFQYPLGMGVRSDWPILAGVLQKGLDAIPEEERNAIFRKWVGVRYEHEFDRSILWKTAIPFLVALVLFVVWNRQLKRTVARRTKELDEAFGQIKSLQERIEAENVVLRKEIRMAHLHGGVVGGSEAMKAVMAQAEEVARTDSTVLILGETGTGKELLARAIHNMSGRRSKSLVIVNCAAMPGALVESELFGHEKGAYTGASARQIGRFEVADGGTIFLDEIGELSGQTQAKLLRVLQEGQFERLGSAEPISVDVRVIAATNRDIERDVRDGKFRKDLFFRLHVFPITLPPLRARRSDIEPLVCAFVSEFAAKMGKPVEEISRVSMEALRKYGWPGNIRELRNVVERAMIATNGPVLKITPPEKEPWPLPGEASLAGVQRRHILSVLEQTGWRIRGDGGAAEILAINPTTLESRMKKLGIERPR